MSLFEKQSLYTCSLLEFNVFLAQYVIKKRNVDNRRHWGWGTILSDVCFLSFRYDRRASGDN